MKHNQDQPVFPPIRTSAVCSCLVYLRTEDYASRDESNARNKHIEDGLIFCLSRFTLRRIVGMPFLCFLEP